MKTKIISIIIGIILLASLMISLVPALTIDSVESDPSEVKPGEKVFRVIESKQTK